MSCEKRAAGTEPEPSSRNTTSRSRKEQNSGCGDGVTDGVMVGVGVAREESVEVGVGATEDVGVKGSV